ncbi:MAG TPA: response regulator [Candidatus Dormibacteraeota bacterium]|nr:response regulator [Candidatus Dormibacteraeota bacterium]
MQWRLEIAKILVVEDDPSLRVVLRLVLEQAGHEMTEAPHGRAALDQLDRDVPDLMLVDSRMPILDGAGLIERVRANPAYESIPIVLLTGFSDAHPGADALVKKPFEKADLLKVVANLLDLAPK